MNKEIVKGIDDNLISLQMAKRPSLDDIEYRTIYSKKGWDMVHFKDNNGDYGMRIFFKKISIDKLESKKFPEWNEIKIKSLIIKKNKRLCMDIRIINSMFLEPFDIFSKNIVSGADICSSEPELLNNIFMKCNQWKLFMKNKKVNKLKSFEQKGLIGELIFLELLMKEIGIKNSLESWKGQDKLSKDFLLSSVGIEVKAKQGGLKGEVQISSEDQLSMDGLSKLFLLVFTIDASTKLKSNSFTLTDKVTEIKEFILQNDSNYLDQFLGELYKSKYDEQHNYKDDFWICVEPYQLFLIDDKCPGITPKKVNCTFIREVKYKLSLEGLKDNALESIDYIFNEL